MTRAYRRRTRPRPVTIGRRDLRAFLDSQASFLDAATGAELEQRPRTRAECVHGPRPCPWAGCRHHMYLDINPDNGSIRINFPEIELWELAETCSLDVADRGELTQTRVGNLLNVSHRRVAQLVEEATRGERLRATLAGVAR